MRPSRNCKIRSSHRLSASKLTCRRSIHKRTGTNPSASFPFVYAHTPGRLFLIPAPYCSQCFSYALWLNPDLYVSAQHEGFADSLCTTSLNHITDVRCTGRVSIDHRFQILGLKPRADGKGKNIDDFLGVSA